MHLSNKSKNRLLANSQIRPAAAMVLEPLEARVLYSADVLAAHIDPVDAVINGTESLGLSELSSSGVASTSSLQPPADPMDSRSPDPLNVQPVTADTGQDRYSESELIGENTTEQNVRAAESFNGVDDSRGQLDTGAETTHRYVDTLPARNAVQLHAGHLDIDDEVESVPLEPDVIPKQLLIVDSSLEDLDQLLSDFSLDDPQYYDILYLDQDADGILQIDSYLQSNDELYEAVHLVTHGAAGQIHLGNVVLDSESLSEFSDVLDNWRSDFIPGTDLIIYGCNVAESENGEIFLQQLASLLDVDIAASENLTGHEDLGGDWTLEYKLGDVRSELIFDDAVQSDWMGVLDSPPAGYPVSHSVSNLSAYTTNVTFAGIDNTTGQEVGGYSNFTAVTGVVTQGSSNDISVTINSSSNNGYVVVWVDWNQDADFTDAGEKYVVAAAVDNAGPHTATIAAPATAAVGTTVLRVSHEANSEPLSDEVFNFGEVEDYGLVVAASPVINAIDGAPLSYSEGDGAVAVTSTLELADADSANLATAVVQITDNYVNGEDILGFSAVGGITGAWNAGTGTMVLSGTGTVAEFQDALRAVTYTNASENPDTTSRTLTFRVNDGALDSNDQSRTIDLTTVNDAPELSAIEPIALGYTESSGAVQISSTVLLSDLDNTHLQSAVVSITTGYLPAEDVLVFTDTPSITGSWNVATGELTLIGTDTVAAYQAALRSVSYQNSSDNLSPGSLTTRFVVNDGQLNSSPQSRNIELSAVNDQPQLSNIETVALTYTENDGAIVVSSTLQLSDSDDANLEGAVVSIGVGYRPLEDSLVFTDTPSIVGTWNAITGELTLSGTDTVAAYQVALRTVAYLNTSDNPDNGSRTIDFVVDDGQLDSNSQDRVIVVTPVNDAPQQTGIESTALSYSENAGQVMVTTTLTLADIDNNTLQSASVSITDNYEAGEDVLAFSDTVNIIGSWDSVNGVLLLSGIDSVAAYQAALRSVSYQNTSENPVTLSRVVTFSVDDGTDNSTDVFRLVDIATMNDAPVQSSIENTALVYSENDTATQITSSIVLTDDDDENIESATISIIANFTAGEDLLFFSDTANISGNYDVLTGVLTLSGTDTLSAYQAALRSVTYQNSSEDPATASRLISFTISDGTVDANSVTRRIEVLAINDNPAPTLSGVISYIENSLPVNLAPTASVTDVDSADFNGGTLTVNFISNADTKDRLLIDSAGTGVGQLSIVGNDVFYEGTQIGTFSGGTDGLTPLVVSFNSAATSAGVQVVMRSIQFEHTSDHPNPTRTFQVSLTDGDSGSASLSETIAITVVNDAPIVFSLPGDTLFSSNDGTVYALDTNVTASVTDPDEAANFNGGSLVLSGSGFDVDDSLGIDTSGVIALSTGLNNGSVLSVGGNTFGTLSSTTNDSISISFGAGATADRVSSVLHALTYTSTSSQLGTRTVDITLNDADGTANGGQESTNALVTIFLADAAGDVVSTDEDAPHQFSAVDFSASGIPVVSINTVTITELPADGELQLNNSPIVANTEISRVQLDSGQLTYVPPADQNGVPYSSFEFYINNGNSSVSLLGGRQSSSTLGENSLAETNEIALSVSNFGLNGVVPNNLSIVGITDNIDAGYLAQGSALILGPITDGTLSAAELTAIDNWVQSGGILVSFANSTGTDTIPEFFSLNLVNSGNENWVVANTANPVINGPFGLVGNIGDPIDPAGNTAYFDASTLLIDDLVLAENELNSEAVIVLREHGAGHILFFSDGAVFREDVTGGGALVTPNDVLVANTLAWVSDLTAPAEIFNLNVVVSPVNDAATQSAIETSALAYNENDGAVAITSSLALDDIDDTNLEGATVAINGNYIDSEDVLSFANTSTITGSWDPATGVLSLSGSDSVAAYQSALQSVTYLNISDNPDTASRTIQFTVNDGDTDSLAVSRDIDLFASNDAPVQASVESSALSYTENDGAVAVTSLLSLTDPDDNNLDTAVVRIETNFVQSEDILDFTDTATITSSWDAATGELTLSGSDSVAAYQAALRAVTYQNTSDNPDTGTRNISILVNDGELDSNIQSRSIVLTPVNDAPVQSGIESVAAGYTENDSAVEISSTLVLADLDDVNLESATVTIEEYSNRRANANRY